MLNQKSPGFFFTTAALLAVPAAFASGALIASITTWGLVAYLVVRFTKTLTENRVFSSHASLFVVAIATAMAPPLA